MITPFSDYDSIPVYEGDFKNIVPGGYVCKIVNVRQETCGKWQTLKVAIDIAEGEFKDYYRQRYNQFKEQDPNAKWGGTFTVFLPLNDNSEQDKRTKQAFKRFTTSVEKSNDGYKWAWDESTLKGKLFGGVFGREQYLSNGTPKFATKCRFANSVDTIRKGNFKIPNDKLLPNSTPAVGYMPPTTAQSTTQAVSVGNLEDFEDILQGGDIPF